MDAERNVHTRVVVSVAIPHEGFSWHQNLRFIHQAEGAQTARSRIRTHTSTTTVDSTVLLKMHRCLLIVEVVEKIAYGVDKGLLNMALTCQAFYNPALDALWRKMRGIEPLVRCLPEHVLGKDDVVVSYAYVNEA